jgi:hypothetical protein
MTLKEVIASSLVIALGIILIIHFALFWIYGGVFIYESNKVILALETLMSIAIIGFGFERLFSIAGRKPNKVRSQEQTAGKQERRQPAKPLLQGQ